MVRGLSNRSAHKSSAFSTVFAVSLIILVFGLLYFYNLGGWLINDDEGSFLYQVWRISEGERPYQDIFTTRWPLFLYTGAGWMQSFGAAVVPMRVLPVCLTLGTALIVFFLARQTLSAEAALLGMVVFLLHPSVCQFGRLFQPDIFYVFFSTLGLYLFARGYKKENTLSYFMAGLIFAIATLYKLLAVLVLAGCVLFLGVTWLRERESRRKTILCTIAMLLPYVIVFGLTTFLLMRSFPNFHASVIGVNLDWGQELTRIQTVLKGLAFLVVFFLAFASICLLALPAAWRGWSGDSKVAVFSWQLPTALAFVALSRELYPRLLLYLLPSLSILFAATLEPVRLLLGRRRPPPAPPHGEGMPLLFLAIIGAVFIPWAMSDVQILTRSERDTMAASRYIQVRTSSDTYVLSDYQELNFHARRSSTYWGAELSGGVVAAGRITGASLIAEIEAVNVGMVIVDVSDRTAHQMANFRDYEDFYTYLQQHFVLLDTLPRGEQQLEIYVRQSLP